MGLMGREAAVAITAALDLPMTPEEYMTESQEIMSQLFSDCTVLPGQKQCTNYSKSVMMVWPTKSSQLRLELVFSRVPEQIAAIKSRVVDVQGNRWRDCVVNLQIRKTFTLEPLKKWPMNSVARSPGISKSGKWACLPWNWPV